MYFVLPVPVHSLITWFVIGWFPAKRSTALPNLIGLRELHSVWSHSTLPHTKLRGYRFARIVDYQIHVGAYICRTLVFLSSFLKVDGTRSRQQQPVRRIVFPPMFFCLYLFLPFTGIDPVSPDCRHDKIVYVFVVSENVSPSNVFLVKFVCSFMIVGKKFWLVYCSHREYGMAKNTVFN